MERSVIHAIVRMCAKSILLTALIGALIGLIGHLNRWDSSLKYSNAFFIAGCLMIIAGTASRQGVGQEWSHFQTLHAETFRGMSNIERINFVINTSSSLGTVVLGVLVGILLMLISAVAAYMF